MSRPLKVPLGLYCRATTVSEIIDELVPFISSSSRISCSSLMALVEKDKKKKSECHILIKNLTLITHHRPKVPKSRPAGQIPENRFRVGNMVYFTKVQKLSQGKSLWAEWGNLPIADLHDHWCADAVKEFQVKLHLWVHTVLWKVNQKKKINFKLHHNPFAADDGTAFLQVQMELIQWQYNGTLVTCFYFHFWSTFIF